MKTFRDEMSCLYLASNDSEKNNTYNVHMYT